MSTVPIESRDAYHNGYSRPGPKFCRLINGGRRGVIHWFARWWRVKPQLGALQLFYVAALLLGAIIGTCAAIQNGWELAPAALRSGPGSIDILIAFLGAWSPVILPLCFLVGLFYKTKTANAGLSYEMDRRRSVGSLFTRLEPGIDHDQLDGQYEARLQEICECIRIDIEEFLQLGRSDVEVLIVRLTTAAGEHAGEMRALARDRPVDHGYFHNTVRAPLETWVYEAIRLGRSLAFHDLRARWFRIHFQVARRENVEYRSLFLMPITRVGETKPYGVLTIKMKMPYLLWPRKDLILERRLSMYVGIVNLFYPRGKP